MSISLRVKNVSHGFGSDSNRHHLFKNLTVTVPAGSSVSISGVSGSGKTSLLCLLAGLDSLQQGSVQYFDSEDKRLANQTVKQLSSFIFQDFHLLEGLSVAQNVALPLQVRGEKNKEERIEFWLKKVGLEHRAQSNINTLSRGEQQRVAIARAFVTEPKLVFADEPTSSLDVTTAEHVQDMLIGLSAELDVTTIFVTHDLDFAAKADLPFRLSSTGLAAL